jgi:hypothetical protein
MSVRPSWRVGSGAMGAMMLAGVAMGKFSWWGLPQNSHWPAIVQIEYFDMINLF